MLSFLIKIPSVVLPVYLADIHCKMLLHWCCDGSSEVNGTCVKWSSRCRHGNGGLGVHYEGKETMKKKGEGCAFLDMVILAIAILDIVRCNVVTNSHVLSR